MRCFKDCLTDWLSIRRVPIERSGKLPEGKRYQKAMNLVLRIGRLLSAGN
jgi:hypothetical protein